jgi:hypothetical protein
VGLCKHNSRLIHCLNAHDTSGLYHLGDARRWWIEVDHLSLLIYEVHYLLALGQVGAMVFAMLKLEQPVLRDTPVTAGGRTIQTDSRGLQVVHAQQVLIQCPLTGTPARIVAQGLQHGCQSVVADIQRVHRLPGALPQRVEALLGPGSRMVQPMVRLG